jgi:diguanylate cyclase (GGDEF)-like protein
MPLPRIDELFVRTRRSRLLSVLDLPHLVICILIIWGHVMLLGSGRLERAENAFLDFFFRRRPPLAVHTDIAVIDINKESLQAIGSWPWPLSYHGQMLDILNKWEAKAVILDFIFQEQARPEEETALQQALSKTPQDYLPVQLESKTGKKFWIHGMAVVLEPDDEKKRWQHSLPGLEEQAKALGHNNAIPDADGVMRRIQPYLSYAGESYFYLPLKAGYDALGKEIKNGYDLEIPLDNHGLLMVNWSGRWQETFQHFSYSDIVRSAQAIAKGQTPMVDPQKLKGKICIIGVSAPDTGDQHVTPLESAYPDLGVQANVLNSVLTGQWLRPAASHTNIFALCMVGFIATLLFVFFGNVESFAAGLILGVLWLASSFGLFAWKGVWIYSFHPLLLILSLFIFSALYNLILSRKEQIRLFDLATRDGLTGLFVIRHFREVLNQAVKDAVENKTPLSVILMDLDNFKKINDTYGHPAGDMVLKKCAEALHLCFRSKRPLHQIDFAARYGGEEFIVMLRDTSLKNAAFIVAERIRKAIQQTIFEWEGTIIPVTVSVGVSSLHSGENVPDVMVRRADEALYRAKKTGKNRVCLETFAEV